MSTLTSKSLSYQFQASESRKHKRRSKSPARSDRREGKHRDDDEGRRDRHRRSRDDVGFILGHLDRYTHFYATNPLISFLAVNFSVTTEDLVMIEAEALARRVQVGEIGMKGSNSFWDAYFGFQTWRQTNYSATASKAFPARF